MNSKNNIGIHLRLKKTIFDLMETAQSFPLDRFQFFLTPSERSNKYLKLRRGDQKKFLERKNEHFKEIYIHSSYWINLASGKPIAFESSKKLLKKELFLAQQLEIKYLVLHPGSATYHRSTPTDPYPRQAGIAQIIEALNEALEINHSVKILLENTAHANRCVGSDFKELVTIRNNVKRPDRIGFCLDFSHAHSFGYDLSDTTGFVDLVREVFGIENIDLIHFNDSLDQKGSKQDHHAAPGHGAIGKATLQALLNHPLLKPIPKIIEFPDLEIETMKKVVTSILSW